MNFHLTYQNITLNSNLTKIIVKVHIQNATLAGGVAVGAVADMVLQPWGAMTIGGLAGMLSVIGFRYITPFLSSHKLHDTCGVNNLHGMPGLMAGIASIIVAFMANKQEYGDRYKVTT